MLIGPADTETQHNFVNKQGFDEISGLAAEIAASLEYQLVDAGNKINAFQNRLIQTTILIGSCPRPKVKSSVFTLI